jgi:hypothetical protein
MKDQSSKQEHMAKVNLQLKDINFAPPKESGKPKIDSANNKPTEPNKDKSANLSALKATIQKLWESLGTESSGILIYSPFPSPLWLSLSLTPKTSQHSSK